MGNGSCKSASPTILKGFRREISNTEIPVRDVVQSNKITDAQDINSTENVANVHEPTDSITDDATSINSSVKQNDASIENTKEDEAPPITTLKVESTADEIEDDPDFVKTIYGRCKSKWPIRCFGKLDFNVNAYHGGCTGLYFVSCSYGGKGEETNAELKLLRSGFDCNQVQLKSIAACHEGHFRAQNNHYINEEGTFIGDCLFGNNDLMLLTNDCRYGNLRNGVFMEMVEDGNPLSLPLNVNGNNGSGLTLILCSSREDDTIISSIYMIRSGFKDNKFQAKLITGEDKYKFNASTDGTLTVTGPNGSKFGIFHNRDNLTSRSSHAFVGQTQCLDGTENHMLLENLKGHSTLLVLCSNSNDTENSTVSSVYHVSLDGENAVGKEISGSHGPSYQQSDVWKFEVVAGQLVITGPPGPCKYGILSNMKASKQELLLSIKQDSCLATGEPSKTRGNVKVTAESIAGYVNKSNEICIMMNHKIIQIISERVVERDTSTDMYTFSYKWCKEETMVGYHMIRVFAVRKHLTSGEDVYIELSGSPFPLTRQKPGVIYALNCGGPAYQDMNDIVYSSEHKQFASFTYDFACGMRCKAAGGIKQQAILPASMLKSHDGFLYTVTRSTFADEEHDQRFTYTIRDLPNGSFKLRMHMINFPKDITCNGKAISKQIVKEMEKTKTSRDLSGPTCYCVDIDIEITDNTLVLYSKSANVYKHADHVAAFALLDSTYRDKVKDENQLKEEEDEKHKLADKLFPLNTSTTRKEMTIVGWSPNLLQNASGQNRDMKHWNTQGDFKVADGGFTTETKFATSHMWCKKYQEVNLLETFSEEYLDTAPDIQVLEMYREGHCGGGFYNLTAQLLSENGKVLKEYTTGEIGTIYTSDQKWQEASVTFSGYGPGVRIVAFTSKGKDDKYWAGHFGVYMSGAEIRVRRESNPAEGDSYSDIPQEADSNKRSVDKMVTRVLSDNKELLKDLMEDENIPVDKAFERETDISTDDLISHQWKATERIVRKKREIRIFVSSTFKDFTNEREEIIKKAFRKINQYCADRGVFFTYVDLRWGITSEQTSDGKTISICLQEIDRCRPYFICLMGDRFGWCQTLENVDDVLNMTYDYAIENNPNLNWIDEYRYNSSVTQLEVFHGVLNNPDGAKDRCFFYLRDTPSKEGLTDDQYKRLVSESDWHRERQESLKSMVTKDLKLNITRFKTPSEVSELIKKDLERCVDEDFPKGTELTKLEEQREAHTAFAEARCRVYIGRQDYFTEINNSRSQNITKPFVILGESGCGKSALVANWTKKVEVAEPNTFLFQHFIGSSADSADYIKLIRRLFEEMKSFFSFDMQIPSSDFILIHEIGKWLRMAGSLTKVVIVFDALNQLDDGSGQDGTEHDLLWIPTEIPPNVFLLISTLPGRAMTACIQAGWPSMKVEPLQESQKMQIITDYLEGIYGKTLNETQKSMIVNVKQTSNPLYLKSLLDEVRMYGSFRTLTTKIQEYLSANSPQDLFAKILERLEDDFEKAQNDRFEDVVTELILSSMRKKGKHLVRDATTALWCSNRGMSESELVEFLDIPSMIWSPFYISLYENLVNRNGLLNFFHDHLRQAVEKKYLSTAEDKRLGYLRLADFHGSKDTSNRTVEELPFLLTRAGELDRLKDTVTKLDVFFRLSEDEDGVFELVKAWKTLGGFALSEKAYMSQLEMTPKQVIMENATYYCKLYSRLGSFYLGLGLMEAAKKVYKTLIKQLELNYGESHGTMVYSAFDQSWKYRCKHPDVIKGLQDLGTVYSKLGEYDKAITEYHDAICRQNKIETPTQTLQLCEGLLGLSTVYIQKENMIEAKKLMTRALELATYVLGVKHHFVAAIFTRLGQLSYKQGRIDEALAYYMQDLKVTRSEVGTNHPRTAIVLNEIGLVYDDKNDMLAGKLYEAALSIILETYGNNYLGTGTIRYNLGAYYFGTNYFAKAKFQLTESYKIHEMFLGEDHPDTIYVKKALETVTKMTSDS